MTVNYTYLALGICISQTFILGMAGLSLRQKKSPAWAILALAICLEGYFLLPIFHAAGLTIGISPSITLAAGIPSLFLIICYLIFEDNPRIPKLIQIIAFIAFGINIIGWRLVEHGIAQPNGPWRPLHRVLISLPILWSLWIILRGWRYDMVQVRLRYRLGFMSFVAILIAGNIVTNDFSFQNWYLGSQRLLVSSWFSALALILLNSLGTTHDVAILIDQPRTEKSGAGSANPTHGNDFEALAKKLAKALDTDKAYLNEGLSLSQLARTIGEPTYKVRQYINQELCHRNFNSFLNRYRIKAAKLMLADPSYRDTKIFSIALEVGFSSLSPFNRSFKDETGQTPSEYRRQKAAQSIIDS